MSSFTPAGSGNQTASVSLQGATQRTTVTVSMPTGGVEYTATVPTNAKQYMLRTKSGVSFRVADSAGETATNYLPVPWQCFCSDSELTLTASKTIYLRSEVDGQEAILVYWT